jgi:hypothetical protein
VYHNYEANLLLSNDEIVRLWDALLWVPVGKVTNWRKHFADSRRERGHHLHYRIAVEDYLKNLPKSFAEHLP